ncbi:hypothetical protein BC777_3291 [Yoonia maricola]|uniref:Fungal lipase-like domain-containing protein n=1 Tax=Yoonia maricola TaxID=420999 RepID=A0A2M8W327_9RHOB|nr:hypothetical protein [Yoonia maricola]PJI85290.1 hypothetical protein BC777_3291 [Yoonia maricola]
MTIYRLKDAATLAEASYKAGRIVSPRVIKSLDHDDVQAHLLDGNILLLPGSNSVRDYVKFNLRPLRLGGQQFVLKHATDSEKGASGTKWHQGFLRYAVEIFEWLKTENVGPNYIIGHSLGAAAAQILSKTYNAPAIGFAAPRPKWSKHGVVRDGRCLLVNRTDDPVPKVPSTYHHMGQTKLFKSAKHQTLFAHSMRHYIDIIEEDNKFKTLPETWGG